MTVYRLSFEKMQTTRDCTVIGVAFVDIGMPGSEMCGDEAEVCVIVVKADRHSTFVSRHPSKSSLRKHQEQTWILVEFPDLV